MIGDRRCQLDQPVAFAGVMRGDRAACDVACGRDVARGDAGVGHRHAPHVGERREKAAAFGQHDRMGIDLAQPVQRRAGDAEQPVLHPHRDLGQQVEFVFGQRVVAFANRAGDRVVDRQQSQVGLSRQHGMGDAAVRSAAERDEDDAAPLGIGPQNLGRIRAFDPLEGGGHGEGAGRRGGGLRTGHRSPIKHKSLSHRREALAVRSLDRLRQRPGAPKRFGSGEVVKPGPSSHVRPMVPRRGRSRQLAPP
jgi:hypothetical protein